MNGDSLLEDDVREKYSAMLDAGMMRHHVMIATLREYSLRDRAKVSKIILRIAQPHAQEQEHFVSAQERYSVNSPLFNCPKNDDGLIIDLFNQSEIPEDKLISYKEDNRVWCFNVDSLYANWKLNNSLVNSLTRKNLPEDVTATLEQMYNPATVTIVNNDRSFEIDPLITTVADVILLAAKTFDGYLFDNVVKYNPIHEQSLYDQDLSYTFVVSSVKLVEFSSVDERNSDELSNSVALFVGAFLRLVPIIEDADIVIECHRSVETSVGTLWRH